MVDRDRPTDPRTLIAALGLIPHPEGGWYAETWREPAPEGGRPAGSAIHFLLEAGQRSRWHRVDATEIWHHYAGDPLLLEIAPDRGPIAAIRLGDDVTAGERPQAVVPAGAWQTARSLGAWTLVGCTVAPAFRFEGFELAPEGWTPGPSAVDGSGAGDGRARPDGAGGVPDDASGDGPSGGADAGPDDGPGIPTGADGDPRDAEGAQPSFQ